MKPKLLTQGLAFIAMCMMAIVPMKAEERKAALVVWNGESELYSFFISDRVCQPAACNLQVLLQHPHVGICRL